MKEGKSVEQTCKYGKGPSKGFASSYGQTNTREDKATVFELWMTRRPLARARIAGDIRGDGDDCRRHLER